MFYLPHFFFFGSSFFFQVIAILWPKPEFRRVAKNILKGAAPFARSLSKIIKNNRQAYVDSGFSIRKLLILYCV